MSASGNPDHLGVSRAPCKSSLSYVNRHRDRELFRMCYFHMPDRLSAMAGLRQVRFRIKGKIFPLDSTTVSLCLSLFDRAVFRGRKGAVKLHTLLDYAGCLPTFILMTDGKVHDAITAKQVSMPRGSVIVADRACTDLANMARWDSEECFLVIRSESSVKYGSLGERPLPDGRHQHTLKDEYIMLSEKRTRQKYPKKLRRVAV